MENEQENIEFPFKLITHQEVREFETNVHVMESLIVARCESVVMLTIDVGRRTVNETRNTMTHAEAYNH